MKFNDRQSETELLTKKVTDSFEKQRYFKQKDERAKIYKQVHLNQINVKKKKKHTKQII